MSLKKLMNELQINGGNNLISGFRKFSIYPNDINELLEKDKRSDTCVVEDAFKTHLDERTEKIFGDGKKPERRKKVNVPAGRIIRVEDVQEVNERRLYSTESDIEDDPVEIDAQVNHDNGENNSAVVINNLSVTFVEDTPAVGSVENTQVEKNKAVGDKGTYISISLPNSQRRKRRNSSLHLMKTITVCEQ